MNLALKEALHTIPKDQFDSTSAAILEYKETMGVENSDNNEKWLIMPRQFSRSAARFSIPINTQTLSTMTPYEYLSRYVWISDYRKHLYRYVFNKYVREILDHQDDDTENDDDLIEAETPSYATNEKSIQAYEFKECKMPFKDLTIAFTDVLGYCGPVEQISNKIENIIQLTGVNKIIDLNINFRSWCGLVAFAERYLNDVPFDDDPCDEVEYTVFFSFI